MKYSTITDCGLRGDRVVDHTLIAHLHQIAESSSTVSDVPTEVLFFSCPPCVCRTTFHHRFGTFTGSDAIGRVSPYRIVPEINAGETAQELN